MRASASPRLFAAALVLCTGLLALSPASLSAQDSSFSYQGHLVSNGASANGSFDMQFRLMSSEVGETPVASVVLPSVAVADGTFTVTLGFAAEALGVPGQTDRWLEISVRPSGSGDLRTVLEPRQRLLSVPFATRAGSATYAIAAEQLTGPIAPGNIPAGTITRSMLAAGVLPPPIATGSPTVSVQWNAAYRATGFDLQIFELPAAPLSGTQVEITGQSFGGWTTFAPWSPALLGAGFSRVASNDNGQVLYSGGLGQALRQSLNGGLSWSEVRPLTNITDVETSSTGSTVAYVDSTLGRIFTSPNAGQTWSTLQNRDAHTLTQVAVSPNGAHVAAAGPANWLSIHDASGAMVYAGEVGDVYNWSALAVASNRIVFAATQEGLIRWTDGQGVEGAILLGSSWKDLACTEDGSVFYVVGTNAQIHRFDRSGVTVAGSLKGPVANYTSIAVSPDGRHVIAGTDNGQVALSHDYGNSFYAAGAVANWTDVALSDDGTAYFGAETAQGIRRSLGNHSGGNDETVRLMFDNSRGWVPVRSSTEVALDAQVGSLGTEVGSMGTQVTSLETRVGVVEEDLNPRVANLESGLSAVNSLTQSLTVDQDTLSAQLAVVQVNQIVQNDQRLTQDTVHTAYLNALQNRADATDVAVAGKVNRSGDTMTGALTVPSHTVTGETRMVGPVRMGSQVGTTELPQFGVITRRINSTANNIGQVVARSQGITLERNSTNGEFRLVHDSLANYTIIFQGIRENGTTVQGVINTIGAAGTQTLFSGLTDVIWMTCTFGDPYNNSHSTEVRMSRRPGDLYWTGFVTSTFNQ